MTIAQALTSIPDTGWDENFIAFGATARMTVLDGPDTNSDPGSYSLFFGLVDQLSVLNGGSQGESQERSTLGFDPQQAPLTVSVGTQQGNLVTTLFGSFDTAAVAAKLTATGFTRSGPGTGTTNWTYKSGGDATLFPMTAGGTSVPGAIALSPSRVVFGQTASSVTALSVPAVKPLSQDAKVDTLAACLGSATTGFVGPLYQQQNVIAATRAALGITAGPGSTASVDICVAADNASEAQAMETRWITGVRTGSDSTYNSAWSSIFTDPQAKTWDQNSSVVRLSAEIAASARPSVVFNEYLGGQISTLILPPSSTTTPGQ